MLTLLLLLTVQADPLKAAADQAGAHLSAGKSKDAVGVLEPLARQAAAAAPGPERARFFYYLGCAAFAEGNDLLAGRSLARLAPFDQPLYAAHARYLLGRLHHRAGEATEALANYDAVGPAFEKEKKNPAPDFVGDAVFHAGVLLYELRQAEPALARFAAILQKEKRPALVEEARLRAGLCQVRLKQNAEAIKTLQPLLGHANLGRTARWWTAQAILRTDGSKPADALAHLQEAAKLPETGAVPSNGELLLALGDVLERSGKPAEAAEEFRKLEALNLEEALARRAGALAAAGKLPDAESVAARLEKEFPSSLFAGAVALRLADAAFAAGKIEEAAQRYQKTAGENPLARYRLAHALVRLNRLPEALAQMRAISEPERTGEMSGVSLLQAEVILRTAPAPEDAVEAIGAAALLKDLQEAVSMLDKAAAATPTPELQMRLAGAIRLAASLMADPAERAAAANKAREMYEAFRGAHAAHPLRPVAEYERANCYALAGDPNQGIQKLERFKADPFAQAPVAPLALLRQGQLYRQVNNPGQAVVVLADCRAKYEAALLKDPARASWVPLLRYHHAAALKAANQAAQATPVLESLIKDFGNSEWAEPARRLLKEGKP